MSWRVSMTGRSKSATSSFMEKVGSISRETLKCFFGYEDWELDYLLVSYIVRSVGCDRSDKKTQSKE